MSAEVLQCCSAAVLQCCAVNGNVWAGRFIGEPALEPDPRLPRYRITFYVLPPRAQVRPMYVVTYVRDPASGLGFVYLPGRGDDGYRMNVRTILREDQDGRWHAAERGWSEAIASALQHPSTQASH